MELGPSGFPFEKYIGELFKHQGYSVHIDQTLQGKCVTHEIDVVAEKGNEMLLMECKYRNLSGITVDVKTPLYIQARFEDILANGFDRKKNFKGWIVTNSGFTTDALKYGNCKGLEMMSWAYPKNKGLKDMIDNTGLYPVTCLTSLTHREKQLLLENNYVLVSDINSNSQLLQLAGVKETRYKNVIDECSRLCQAQ